MICGNNNGGEIQIKGSDSLILKPWENSAMTYEPPIEEALKRNGSLTLFEEFNAESAAIYRRRDQGVRLLRRLGTIYDSSGFKNQSS
jgi:hypothetical protein